MTVLFIRIAYKINFHNFFIHKLFKCGTCAQHLNECRKFGLTAETNLYSPHRDVYNPFINQLLQ